MPACMTKEIALDVGLRFTAIGSATATGLDVSLSGGCLFEKNASPRFENKDFQTEVSFSSSNMFRETSVVPRLPGFSSRSVNTKLPISSLPVAEIPAPPNCYVQAMYRLSLKPTGIVGIRSIGYQIPLSLPVSFCPTTAAVASQGNKPSRALLFNSRLRSSPANCDP